MIDVDIIFADEPRFGFYTIVFMVNNGFFWMSEYEFYLSIN